MPIARTLYTGTAQVDIREALNKVEKVMRLVEPETPDEAEHLAQCIEDLDIVRSMLVEGHCSEIPRNHVVMYGGQERVIDLKCEFGTYADWTWSVSCKRPMVEERYHAAQAARDRMHLLLCFLR